MGKAPGRLFVASFTDVGPDPAKALDSVDADILVCLIEPFEIDLRFPEFKDWLVENLDRSMHWPIPDWGVLPDDEMLALVADVVHKLRDGQDIVLHCGAGIGRTGVVSILAMVSMGMPVEEAALWVRKHRGGAGPDSQHQQDQVERLAPLLAPHG